MSSTHHTPDAARALPLNPLLASQDGLVTRRDCCETLAYCAGYLHLLANVNMQDISEEEAFAFFSQLLGTADVLQAVRAALTRITLPDEAAPAGRACHE